MGRATAGGGGGRRRLYWGCYLAYYENDCILISITNYTWGTPVPERPSNCANAPFVLQLFSPGHSTHTDESPELQLPILGTGQQNNIDLFDHAHLYSHFANCELKCIFLPNSTHITHFRIGATAFAQPETPSPFIKNDYCSGGTFNKKKWPIEGSQNKRATQS
jgi:hypothetical protein